MNKRYQTLIDNVSGDIADRLLEDRQWLKEHHRLGLDALMFQLVMQIGLVALRRLFEGLLADEIEDCRAEGMCIARSKTVRFSTKLGTIPELDSPYLRDRQTGQSARPLKEVFGVAGQGKSMALERALSDFGSETSYADAEKRFRDHYGFSIGRTSILRVTGDVGEDAEAYIDDRLARSGRLRDSAESITELVAQLDGSAVRCGEYMPASQAGLTAQDGYEPDDLVRCDEWMEVRVGVLRDVDEDDTKYVCQKGDYEDICDQMKALAESMGWQSSRPVIATADGAHGLKEAFEDVFENVQFILDIFHLKQHFYETAESLGLADELKDGWVETYMDRIWQGDVEKVLEQLRQLNTKTSDDRLDRLIHYVDKFSNCVDYETYQEAGWPIGSGEVESAHRYIPQDRLKLPGACWREDSINPMMAIRVIKKNGWWDDFWDWRCEKKKSA